MRFAVVTIFPGIVEAYLGDSILGRARGRGIYAVDLFDPREFTTDRHRCVDDVPFGGGAGMVFKPDPLARAIEAAGEVEKRILLTPAGRRFEQRDAEAWSKLESITLICGRYEGIDERVCKAFVDEEISVGDYVLTGGELAAMIVLDATIRLLPGALGNAESPVHESFSEGLLEHPHYTRPAEWRGCAVPPVLLSGHHAQIDRWRRRSALERTAERRPDLLETATLTEEEREWLRARHAAAMAEEE